MLAGKPSWRFWLLILSPFVFLVAGMALFSYSQSLVPKVSARSEMLHDGLSRGVIDPVLASIDEKGELRAFLSKLRAVCV